MAEKKKGKESREIEVLPRSYKPTRAELEEVVRIDATHEQLAQALFNTRPKVAKPKSKGG